MAQTLSVREALLAMMEAIRSGEIQQARGIGERCVLPLSLTAAELALSGKMSAGAESTVFRGSWRGQQAAVKKLRISTSADLDRFRSELVILSSLSHPAVVPLLGARALPPDYLLILPLAAGGNLRSALYERGWRPSWATVLDVARQVASGMAHVHAKGYIHRDLKPANVLLLDPPGNGVAGGGPGGGGGGAAAADGGPASGPAAAPRVQVADFGLALRFAPGTEGAEGASAAEDGLEATLAANGLWERPSGGFHKRQMVGTLEYMAPELLLRTAPASTASDVYAWAVTVNELATGVVPFSNCTKDNPEVHTVLEMGYGRMELAAAVSAEGLRPLLPKAFPPGFAALINACWHVDPAARPSFGQVLAALETLAATELPAWEAAQGQAAPAEVSPPIADVKGTQGPHTVVVDVVMVDADAADAPSVAPPTAANGNHLLDHEPSPAPLNNGCGGGDAGCIAASAGQPLWPFELCPSSPNECSAAGATAGISGTDAMDGKDGEGWLAARMRAAAAPGTAGTAAAAPSPGGGGVPYGTSAVFHAGVFEAQGPRDSMEDRHVLLPDLWGRTAIASGGNGNHHLPPSTAAAAPCNGHYQPNGGAAPISAAALPPVPLAAVFDGHRGSEAADFCAARLPGALRAALASCPCPASALRRAFIQLETDYHASWRAKRAAHLQLARGPTAFPGTTALAVMLDATPPPPTATAAGAATAAIMLDPTPPTSSSRAAAGGGGATAATITSSYGSGGGTLYIANAGDCRAALVRRRTAFAGSRDHTGLLAEERGRLGAAGVEVTWQHGGWRVGSTGLQVTRCIGDFDVKPGAPASSTALPPTGVTAVPEVTRLALTPDDLLLILASDGLWEVVGLQEAAGLVFDTVKDPTLAAKRLACEALMRGAPDNVTVLVVFLADVSTVERVFSAAEGGEAFRATGTAYGSRTRMEADRARAGAAADEVRDTY